jgi:ankyrin repeat protein
MDFDTAFATCIRDGNTAGITALGIDSESANEILLTETPMPADHAPLQIPIVRRPTPLIYAIYCGRPSVVEQLHGLGADLTTPLYNWRPVHYATATGEVAILDYILTQSPSEKDSLTDHKATPLHIAVSGRNSEAIVILLKHGADVTLANANGETALHIAMIHFDPAIAEILVSFGGRLDAKNGKNQTPRDIAAERGNKVLLDWLDKVEGDSGLVRSQPQILSGFSGKRKEAGLREPDLAAQIDVLNQRVAALEELLAAKDSP